jgi:exosortase/archaeosortase family protein
LVIRQIGGPSWVRHFAFPVVFLLVAVPWPSTLENPLVQRLMRVSAGLTIEIIRLVGIPGVRHGNLIEVGSGVVNVDGACSGVRSLQTSLMLALLFGEAFRLRAWWRVGLIPLGFALAFFANVARTSLLTWAAATRGTEFMEQKLHDAAGVGVVAVVLGGVYLAALWASRRHSVFSVAPTPEVKGQRSKVSLPDAPSAFAKATADRDVKGQRSAVSGDSRLSEISAGESPAATVGGPQSVVSAEGTVVRGPWSVVTGAYWVMGFAAVWLVTAEVATAYWFHLGDKHSVANAVWAVNWPTNAVGYAEGKMTKNEIEMLRYDEARKASWQDEAGNAWSLIALHWAPENKNSFIGHGHTPDQCFTGAGWELQNEPEPVRVKFNGIEMPFRRYVFDVDGKTAYAFLGFWDERSPGGEQEPGVAYGFSRRLRAAWEGKRNQGFKKLEISIIGPASADEAVSVLHDGLERLIVVK